MKIILTELGEQLASEGFLTGIFPKITKVKFGDGNGNMVVPDKAMTNLKHFVSDGLGTTIARFNNPNRLYIYTMIPVTIGGFTVREIGLFTEADELIAIGGEFEKVKPPIGESTENFDFYITLPISSTQEITVEFSNDNLYASQAALDVISNVTEAMRLELQYIKANAVPTGIIISHAGVTAPTGFLICDGSTLSRTTYANLFDVIGRVHGNGDGSTTFNIPDLRGEFIRGVDLERGIDYLNISSWSYISTTTTINTATPHNLKVDNLVLLSGLISTTNTPNGLYYITTITGTNSFTITTVSTPTGTPTMTNARVIRSVGSSQMDDLKSHTHGYIAPGQTNDFAGGSGRGQETQYWANSGATGGVETRPRNIALLYCIKY